MTDHPLTDEMIDEIQMRYGGPCERCNDDMNMRAAFDVGIQAVIDFLESTSYSDRLGTLYYPTHGDDESVSDAIRRAMYQQEES